MTGCRIRLKPGGGRPPAPATARTVPEHGPFSGSTGPRRGGALWGGDRAGRPLARSIRDGRCSWMKSARADPERRKCPPKPARRARTGRMWVSGRLAGGTPNGLPSAAAGRPQGRIRVRHRPASSDRWGFGPGSPAGSSGVFKRASGCSPGRPAAGGMAARAAVWRPAGRVPDRLVDIGCTGTSPSHSCLTGPCVRRVLRGKPGGTE